MAETTTGTATGAPRRPDNATVATRGAFYGFFVDMFDIYLPVVALAPAIEYFLSPQMSPATATLVTAVMFAATLVGRPLGALVFGPYADRRGRKRATLVAVGGFGALTVVIGCLPGYETWGMTSVVLFVALRLVVGIFVGGEYTAASPLAMEAAPKEKRGLYGAVIMTGFPLAFVTMSLLTFVVLEIAPADGPGSPYLVWGWRIPFFVGGILAAAFCVYFARHVEESELFVSGGGGGSPLRNLSRGQDLRNFLQVFVLMTGFWLSLNTVSAVLPNLLGSELGFGEGQTTLLLVVAFALVPVGQIGLGLLSQRIGRRRVIIGWSVITAIAGTGLYAALLIGRPGLLGALVLTAALTILVVSVWGLATTYINERFRTGVRASGFGLGYSLAVVLPSFYVFYQRGLETLLPQALTVLPLLVIACVFTAAGAALGPETKDVDFSVDDAR